MKIWVVLYKDELHNQTGPDYIVDRVFDEEYKVIHYATEYNPEYWKNHFLVVEKDLL